MDKKWNLQDIRPPESGERSKPKKTSDGGEPKKARTKARSTKSKKNGSRSGGSRKSLIVALVIAALIIPMVLTGFLFRGAEITVFPRTQTQTINATFTAYQSPEAGELGYEVITLEADTEREVTATGEEEVEEQATGTIVIENRLERSERLIKNTRFESPDGLVFRITESAEIPAATVADDGTVTPGTARATVFADQPGEEYNIDPTEFTIPGYAENNLTELYENITGYSEEPMTGGFAGISYTVDDAELAEATESMREELESALARRVDEERPAGFVLPEGSVRFSYTSLPSEERSDEIVAVREQVTLTAPLFAEEALGSFLAEKTVLGYEGEPVTIRTVDDLTFAYTGTSTPADLRTTDSIGFELTGPAQFVWQYDEESLVNDLTGAAQTALPTILGGYPTIERAEATISPFWSSSFPDEADAIEVNVVLPE